MKVNYILGLAKDILTPVHDSLSHPSQPVQAHFCAPKSSPQKICNLANIQI